jgi:hypothetical protein
MAVANPNWLFKAQLTSIFGYCVSYFLEYGNSVRSFSTDLVGTIIAKTNQTFKHYNYICHFRFLNI